MFTTTVIGRGHSGTRAIAHTLYASGVYMGHRLNPSGDKVPEQAMYDACRIFGKHVQWNGGHSWDFSSACSANIDPEFERLINSYLDDVLHSERPCKGWKIPETTLCFPWIVRMFPNVKYIYWVRDPRDCVMGGHVTDDLSDFGISHPVSEDIRERRAISWDYQYKLVKHTPKPKHWLEVRFEDFVLDQERTLERLEAFLGIELARVIVRPESVARWKTDTGRHQFDFLADAMRENGYD
jgi:hypothetical protein